MFWTRIDNRLIHGQIIETWIPYTGARQLVVANDEMAADVLQQEITALAIPTNVSPHFVRVDLLREFLAKLESSFEHAEIMVLFANCKDAKRAFESGFAMKILNVGNLHYGPGKKQLLAHVALSSDDEKCLAFFSRQGVSLDFRCIPTETVQVKPTW